MDEEVPGGPRGGSKGDCPISGQHEFDAARTKRAAVKHETNETHGHPLLLCQQTHSEQDSLAEALSNRRDVGRLLYEAPPGVSFRSSS